MMSAFRPDGYDDGVTSADDLGPVLDLLFPDPHPDLVAAQKVTLADLLEHGGLFPANPLFAPAVPARPAGDV
jgi:hypothetical protein